MTTSSRIEYKGVTYKIAAADEKTWKPGDEVPEGYKVVFGKLRKVKPGQHSMHNPSTNAWKSTHVANNTKYDGTREQWEAHHRAHTNHADAYLSNLQAAKNTTSPEKKKGYKHAANLHKKAAKEHYQKHLEAYEHHMTSNPTISRESNPHGDDEMPRIMHHVREQRLLEGK